MSRFVLGCFALCVIVALGGGTAQAQEADSFVAEYFGSLAGGIESTGSNLSHRSSVLYHATFGNFETPYDFFFQPWELPQIAFPQTWHLGNRHAEGEGDYKSLYWSQLSNNARDFSDSDVDVLST